VPRSIATATASPARRDRAIGCSRRSRCASIQLRWLRFGWVQFLRTRQGCRRRRRPGPPSTGAVSGASGSHTSRRRDVESETPSWPEKGSL
jgi:hypothetical protein